MEASATEPDPLVGIVTKRLVFGCTAATQRYAGVRQEYMAFGVGDLDATLYVQRSIGDDLHRLFFECDFGRPAVCSLELECSGGTPLNDFRDLIRGGCRRVDPRVVLGVEHTPEAFDTLGGVNAA
jgi:hypothetical protein